MRDGKKRNEEAKRRFGEEQNREERGEIRSEKEKREVEKT